MARVSARRSSRYLQWEAGRAQPTLASKAQCGWKLLSQNSSSQLRAYENKPAFSVATATWCSQPLNTDEPGTWCSISMIYGMSSFPLTNMFQDGSNHQPVYIYTCLYVMAFMTNQQHDWWWHGDFTKSTVGFFVNVMELNQQKHGALTGKLVSGYTPKIGPPPCCTHGDGCFLLYDSVSGEKNIQVEGIYQR